MKLIKISNLNFSIQLLGFISFLFVSSFLNSAPQFTSNKSKLDLGQRGLNDIEIADFNNDGRMDVVISEYFVGDGTATIEFRFSKADGTGIFDDLTKMKESITGGDGLFFNPDGLAVGDITGDGVLDIAIAASSTSQTTDNLTHIHKGTLVAGKYTVSANSLLFKLKTSGVPNDVVIGKFNKDNFIDIIILHRNGISLFEGTAIGQINATPVSIVTGRQPTASNKIYAEDVNNDGTLDIITNDAIYFNDPTKINTFIKKASYSGTNLPISSLSAITIAEFNGDSILDVAYTLNYPQAGTTPPSSNMVVMLSSGSGMNVAYTKKETPKILNSVIKDLATADLDLDGITDVVTLDYNQDALHVYTGYGDGSFNFPVKIPITPATGVIGRIKPKLIAILKGDSDQLLDILTANDANNSTPSLSVLTQNTAKETFEFGPKEYTVPIPAQIATPLSVKVLRKYPKATSTTVNYAVVNGAAKNGTDFIALKGPTNLTFAKGILSQTIPITISANSNPVNSDFTIDLKDSAKALLDTATITLQSGVAAPTLSFFATNFNLYEDPAKANTLITVIRSPPNTLSSSTVDVISEDILNTTNVLTATQTDDYTKLTQKLTFLSGVNSQDFTITIVDDALVEGDEKFRINLINEVNAKIFAPSAIVTIIDNDTAPVILPVANPDSVSFVNSIGLVTIPVLDNDTPTNAIDPKTVAIKLNPTKGTATADPATGIITYELLSKTDTGTDSFTYTVSDNNGKTTSPATVTITIIEAPVAGDDAESIVSNAGSKTFPVIGNDSAASTNSLVPGSVTIKTQGTKGKATVNATGDVTYALNSISETGKDSFTYTVDDSTGNTSLPATVIITIIDAPVALNDDFFILDNEVSKLFNIIKNDSTKLPKKIDPASVVIVKQPIKGNLILEADGSVTYELTPGSSGKDSFTYTVDDDDNIPSPSEIATVTVSILTPVQVKPGVFSFDTNNTYSASEKTGKLVLNIIRESGSTGEVILTYLIIDNSAKAGIDFKDNTVSVTPNTLTFAEGVTSMPITLGIISDTEVEPDEDFSITLTLVTTGVIVATDPKLITITDSTVVIPPPSANPAAKASGGGGGCTLQVMSRFDPAFPLLLLLSLLYLGRRVRIKPKI